VTSVGTARRLGGILLAVLAVAAAVLVVVVMAARLRYGVEFHDEPYYAAVSYRFVLGDRPFVDEMNILQLASLLTFPFVKAWVVLTGGTSGVVLFLRVLWLAFAAGLSVAGFLFLRTLMRWPVALVASLVPLVAAPFGITTLSYNTMGAGLLALGMILGAWATVNGRGRRWLLAAGLAHGLAVVAYPTLAVAVLAYAAALVALYRREALRPLAAYVGGGAVVAAGLCALLLSAGVGNVAIAMRYMTSLGGYAGGGSKIVRVGRTALAFLGQQPLFVVALVVALAAVLALRDRGRWALLLPAAAIFPVAVAQAYVADMGALILYGILGVWLGLFARGRPTAQRLYVWGVLPALVGAAITAYTSSNGFINAAIGFFPAVFATAGMLALTTERPDEERGAAPALLPWLLIAVFALLVFNLGRYQWRVFYQESSRALLTAEVPAGPFAGLWTTPDKVAFDAQLRRDVSEFVHPGQRVMFFDGFPAGYLYTTARPAANTLWLSLSDERVGAAKHATTAYWARTGHYPDVAFRYTWRTAYPPGHVLTAYVAPPRYRLIATRDKYEVWVRTGK
jgi:hypothetical protein